MWNNAIATLLDLISNKESFDRFMKRSQIISEIRRYLDAMAMSK